MAIDYDDDGDDIIRVEWTKNYQIRQIENTGIYMIYFYSCHESRCVEYYIMLWLSILLLLL